MRQLVFEKKELLRRLGHRRAIFQSDGEPSIVAHKTATFVLWHVHLILTMASDAISFFRIGRDGLTAEMRRSGRAWKKLFAEFGESAAAAQLWQELVECNQSCMLDGILDVTRIIITTVRVVKAEGFRKLRLLWQPQLSNWFCEKVQLANMPPLAFLSLPCGMC